MLTRYLISLTLLLSTVACVAQSNTQSQTLHIKLSDSQQYSVAVERDANVAKDATPEKIRIVGVIKGIAIILVDTYRSIPGGMSYCQAGSESFLRVVSIA